MVAGSGVIEQADWRIPDIGRVVSFGRNGDGELYLISAGGVVHKIIRGTPPTS
ncbi:hypothetical protein [Massilia sp. TWR1-2-2]|uniref:hypothetical protein n=1 Tax=Massilia sp. TWR1-2-2 TaxID=2804584 RepID=UPI003CF13976